MIRTEAAPSIDSSLLTETAAPAPLGMVFFGLTLLLHNLYTVGIFPLSPLIMALGVFYGAAGQIFVGIHEWRRNRIFGATAFTAFGLFWLSLIALTILPRAGYGQMPEASAMTAYSGIWCLFAGILMLGALQLSRSLQAIFAAFFLYLLLHTIGTCGYVSFTMLARYEGILTGAVAIGTGIILAFDHRFGRE